MLLHLSCLVYTFTFADGVQKFSCPFSTLFGYDFMWCVV